MTRPSFQEIYSQMAMLMAKRSTCRRLSVGAVITSEDYRYVYGVGYNGNAQGLANDCDSDEPGKCGCIHAEVNAVVNCTVGRTVPKIVFCTDLPCVNCAKVLINLGGVKKIWYGRDYRIRDSLALFEKVGIMIEMMPAKVSRPDCPDCGRYFDRPVTNPEMLCDKCRREVRVPRAVCGVCVEMRSGIIAINKECPEHGKDRPGQGAVEPQRSNAQIATEGFRAIQAQDERKAIEAVDAANAAAVERDPQLKAWLVGENDRELLKAWLSDPSAPHAEPLRNADRSGAECLACWALRETGGNERFIHKIGCEGARCGCGQRLIPSCPIHGVKLREWAANRELTRQTKATEFGGKGRENRFAYMRDADGFIRGCVRTSLSASEMAVWEGVPPCDVCHGDCPDKTKFEETVKVKLEAPANAPPNISACPSCGLWFYDTMFRRCGSCGSTEPKMHETPVPLLDALLLLEKRVRDGVNPLYVHGSAGAIVPYFYEQVAPVLTILDAVRKSATERKGSE